ncbi:MAG: hypothetical protein C5B43_00360 [Verrucomicrobia bacterium]|nr:MAG: hypothetical protein C5B43_00360 [Verrucomicrobiota bacterium]
MKRDFSQISKLEPDNHQYHQIPTTNSISNISLTNLPSLVCNTISSIPRAFSSPFNFTASLLQQFLSSIFNRSAQNQIELLPFDALNLIFLNYNLKTLLLLRLVSKNFCLYISLKQESSPLNGFSLLANKSQLSHDCSPQAPNHDNSLFLSKTTFANESNIPFLINISLEDLSNPNSVIHFASKDTFKLILNISSLEDISYLNEILLNPENIIFHEYAKYITGIDLNKITLDNNTIPYLNKLLATIFKNSLLPNLNSLILGNIESNFSFNLPNSLTKLIIASIKNTVNIALSQLNAENLQSLTIGNQQDVIRNGKFNDLSPVSNQFPTILSLLQNSLPNFKSLHFGELPTYTTLNLPDLPNLEIIYIKALQINANLTFPNNLEKLNKLVIDRIDPNSTLTFPASPPNLTSLSIRASWGKIKALFPQPLDKLQSLTIDSLKAHLTNLHTLAPNLTQLCINNLNNYDRLNINAPQIIDLTIETIGSFIYNCIVINLEGSHNIKDLTIGTMHSNSTLSLPARMEKLHTITIDTLKSNTILNLPDICNNFHTLTIKSIEDNATYEYLLTYCQKRNIKFNYHLRK